LYSAIGYHAYSTVALDALILCEYYRLKNALKVSKSDRPRNSISNELQTIGPATEKARHSSVIRTNWTFACLATFRSLYEISSALCGGLQVPTLQERTIADCWPAQLDARRRRWRGLNSTAGLKHLGDVYTQWCRHVLLSGFLSRRSDSLELVARWT